MGPQVALSGPPSLTSASPLPRVQRRCSRRSPTSANDPFRSFTRIGGLVGVTSTWPSENWKDKLSPAYAGRAVLGTERVERRLTAILAADVAGYSRLMGADEESTLAQSRSYRSP